MLNEWLYAVVTEYIEYNVRTAARKACGRPVTYYYEGIQ